MPVDAENANVVLSFVERYWKQLGAIAAACIYIGRQEHRLSALEKEPKVNVSACAAQMKACQALVTSEFGHGTVEFAELKTAVISCVKAIDEERKERNDKHLELVKLILEMKK